jgi:hypothetical protein
MEIKRIEKTRRKNMKENIHVLIKRSGETRGKNKTKIKLLLKVSRPFFPILSVVAGKELRDEGGG